MGGLLRILSVLFDWLFFCFKKKHSDENEQLEEIERFQQDATRQDEQAVQSRFNRWRTAARLRRDKRL